MHSLSTSDVLISQISKGLRVLFANANKTQCPSPTVSVESEPDLNDEDKKRAARLIRVNHSGEVAAQGLYQGHSCVARSAELRDSFLESAKEETAHLGWCAARLFELDDRPSVFTPVWYLGAFGIGTAVGVLGDEWSLGFVSETEKQVVKHLDAHLGRLPEQDVKSRDMLLKMREDEVMHDKKAQVAGARELPVFVKVLMSGTSKVMTKTAYWI